MVLASVKLAVLDPVVDHTFSDSEAVCNVGNRDLSWSKRRWYLNPVCMAQPAYCRYVERSSGSSAEAGNGERRSDLLVATGALLPYEFDRTQWRAASRRPTHQ
jgi:hypothetical protein